MQVIDVELSKLKEYANNPRNNENAIEVVQKSIASFGFKVPIVIDKDFTIVAGHTRKKAAEKLGLEEVPCIIADDLSEEQIKAFRLADNKTAELAEWNFEKLEEELLNINIDMSSFGFEEIDFDIDLNDTQEDNFNVEEALEEVEEPITKVGDIWQLGNHRLICGDSTDKTTIEKLMDGVRVDMVVTDPPYNVNYKGAAGSIQNDNMKDNEFKEFLTSSFTNMFDAMKEGAAFYIWYSSRKHSNFELSLLDAGLETRQDLIWVKHTITFGRQDYQWQHEPCLYGWKNGASHNWYSDRKQTTILNYDKPTKSELHPTMKPLDLISYQINNSSKKNDLVLDIFGGSGTTLIACEQLNRNCYMAELDPKYCDVIIKRWEALTNDKAKLIRIDE